MPVLLCGFLIVTIGVFFPLCYLNLSLGGRVVSVSTFECPEAPDQDVEIDRRCVRVMATVRVWGVGLTI